MASPRRPVLCLLAIVALLATACPGSSDAPGVTDTTAPPAQTNSPASTEEVDDGPSQTVQGPEEVPQTGDLTNVWSKLSEPGVGGRITSIAFDPSDPSRLLVGGDMLGIAITDDFGTSWQSTTGLASWEIGDITATPAADGRIWTGSLSGPQASSDGGLTWELARTGMPALNDSRYTMPIESVLIDPTNPSHLLAFNGNQRNWEAAGAYRDGNWQGDGSVWESTDAGASWSQLAIVASGGNIRAATFLGGDSNRLAAAVANRGVWTSSDGGATWVESASGLPHFNTYDITGDPTNADRAWVALGEGPLSGDAHIAGGIWVTLDGGASWNGANDGLNIVANATAGNTGRFHQIVAAPSNPDRLYTSNVAPGQAAIYRSDDGGGSWSVIADGATPRPNPYEGALRAFDIAVSSADPDTIAIGSDDTLMGSTNGGKTWDDLTTLEDRSGFFAGRGYSGLVSTDIVFNPSLEDEMILLGFDGGNFIQTKNGGDTWRRTVQDISAWGGAVEAVYSPTNTEQIYVLLGQFSNFRGIGISSDGGTTFTRAAANAGLPAVGNVEFGAQGITALDANGTDIVLAVIGGQVWRSTDSGQSFAVVGGMSGIRDVVAVADGAVYAAAPNEVMVSTDGGDGYNKVPSSPAGITHLFTSAGEPGSVYAVAFRSGAGGVHKWDGSTWTQLFDDQFAHGVAVDPSNPSNIAIVTTEPAFHDVSNATGVHLSNDGGQTWTVVNTGLPMIRLRTAEFDPHVPDRLVVGTTGRGFYEISFSQALG